MADILFNDDVLWKWMSSKNDNNDDGTNHYLKLISGEQIDSGYIIPLLEDNPLQKNSLIMENLSLYLPRDYFLEVQFCAKTYASIFGQIFPPLAAYVSQLAYIEWLLYTEPGYLGYRDHLVHMFKVAFVGDRLLNMNEIDKKITNSQFNSSHFKGWCNSRNFQIEEWNDEEKKNVIRIACFLASMFHDFGYGYYFLREYKKRLYMIYEWLLPGADPTDINTSGMKKLLKSLPAFFVQEHHVWLNLIRNNNENNAKVKDSKIKDNVVAGFFSDCLPLNHSIASTFFLLSIAEKLWDVRALSQKLYIAFHLAAEATMIHDMVSENKWAHLAAHSNQKNIIDSNHFLNVGSHSSVPLAILLILSDELAVWNRPKIIPELRDNSVSYKMDIERVPKEIEISVSNGEIKINPKDNKGNIMKETFKECFDFSRESDGQTNLLGYRINIESS